MAPLRQIDVETAHHARLLHFHRDVERLFVSVGSQRQALFGELLVDLGGHLVHAQLHDRHVRHRRFQAVEEAGLREVELRLTQLVEGAAGVNQHQVALVTEQLHQGGAAAFAFDAVFPDADAVGVPGAGADQRDRFGGELGARRGAQPAQLRPADAKCLMEKTPAFQGLGNKRIVHERSMWRARRDARVVKPHMLARMA